MAHAESLVNGSNSGCCHCLLRVTLGKSLALSSPEPSPLSSRGDEETEKCPVPPGSSLIAAIELHVALAAGLPGALRRHEEVFSEPRACPWRSEECDPPRRPGSRSISGMCVWNDLGEMHRSWNLRHELPRTEGQGAAGAHPPTPAQGPGAGVGVGLHRTAAAQARPAVAVNLLFFHVICSQMYYRARRC